MKKIQKGYIGLIGAGYWGKNILRNLYELGVLGICCDPDIKAIASLKKNFSDIRFSQSFKEALEDQQIKAVAIATPAKTHYQVAKKALLCKKDIFIEKPLAMTVKEGSELMYLARKNKRILMVGHILHYHPAVIKLKELISRGALGKIQYIYSNRLNIGKLRTEEDILWSFAPHDISAILMLVGDNPCKVSCYGGDYINRGIYDTTLTALEFKNGVKGHIFVSWLHPFKEQKLIVVGSKAMAVFDDMKNEKLVLYKHKIEWKNGRIPVAHKADYEVIKTAKIEPLRAELKHFIQCVKNRNNPDSDAGEALRVLKVLSMCESSLLKKK